MFDTFVIDAAKRELIAAGTPLRVEPKVLDLLLYLIERRDRVVSKDELVDAVWQGRFISDAAISSSVARRPAGARRRRSRAALPQDGARARLPVRGLARGGGIGGIEEPEAQGPLRQQIRYCHSADGTRIAYATAGSGSTLVKAANWLHHLEFDWESPVWRHVFEELASNHRLVRYDGRGMGLSQWDVTDFSLERQVEDLEAVVEAAGLERFALFGLSQGCAKSVVYAARHPERVSKLVLYGGYARGWKTRGDPSGAVLRRAAIDLIRVGWGQDNPAVRQMFTSLYMPDAPAESQLWFSDLQRKTTSAENAAAILDVPWRRRHPRPAGAGEGADAGHSRPPRRRSSVRAGAGTGCRHPGRAIRGARHDQPHPSRDRSGMAPLCAADPRVPERVAG